MAYDADKKPSGLSTLTSLDNDDTVIVGDTSDVNEVVKTITWTNVKSAITTLVEGLSSYFNVTTGTSDDITEGSTNLFFTTAEQTKLSGIETSADVTDATNVSAAGASIITSGAGTPASTPSKVGDIYIDTTNDIVYVATDTASSADWDQATGTGGGDLLAANNLSDLANAATARTNLGVAIGSDVQAYDADLTTWANITPGTGVATALGNAVNGAGGVQGVLSEGAFANGDKTKLDGIEASADVTDATNVTAAGALMDSELTDIAFVKAVSDADVSTVNTGTSTTAVPTADSLAGSYAGTKSIQMVVFDFATDVATGDGKFYFRVPPALNGMDIVNVHAEVITAGTTGTTDIQLHNVTDAVDILSTKLTIDSTETGSDTAATAAVINTANDDLATNDIVRVDVDAVSTTAPQGLIISFECRLP